MKSFNAKIIEEFRANDGKVAMFADYPMVILHTIGAKSGNPLDVPLLSSKLISKEIPAIADSSKTHRQSRS